MSFESIQEFGNFSASSQMSLLVSARFLNRIGPLSFRYYSSQRVSLSVGQSVKVLWNGVPWCASVQKLEDDKCMVSYTNWSRDWDEWIELSSSRFQTSESINSESRRLSDVESAAPASVSVAEPIIQNANPKERRIVKLDVAGRSILSSRLRDGRLVFKDPISGILSLSIPPVISTPSKPAPLPEGFLERTDAQGTPYFFNTVNSKSQYERPKLAADKVAANMAQAKSVSLPVETYFDVDGKPFYRNLDTGKVAWYPPTTAQSVKPAESVAKKSSVIETKSHVVNVAESVLIDNQVLPNGWEVHYTDDGFPYYFNPASNESLWELPEESSTWTPELKSFIASSSP